MNFVKNLAKKFSFLFPIYTIIERSLINKRDFVKYPPILVYQMGKVGSESLFESIKTLRNKYSIYYIHWFSDDGIKRKKEHTDIINNPVATLHLNRCYLLKTKYQHLTDIKWRIITLVREPIGQQLSALLQNIKYHKPHLIDKFGKIKLDETLKSFVNKMESYNINTGFSVTWFDLEFKKALNIDIYKYPFDKGQGYQIIKKNNLEILIIKVEKLNSCFQDAISTLLGDEFKSQIINANITEKKEYAYANKFIRENFILSLISIMKNIWV